jgi:NAD(P)-dependent dehydrogenase (short-subunit alcohol dehydrogenase family)
VTISGRTAAGVAKAVAELSAAYDPDRVFGHPCDVRHLEQLQSLWDAALDRYGKIDIWINNAGIGQPQTPFWEHDPDQCASIVGTNLLGAMYGSRVALRGMLDQGFGAVYNMEGMGADGRKTRGFAAYGTSKSAVRFFTESLALDTAGTPVIVGALSPGMVITEFITGQYEGRPEDLERVKPIFNVLADKVETVAPWLADRVLANHKNGARIVWLTTPKILARFLTSPFLKRDLFK